TAGEVDVDDVKAARAETEVERLGVDDHLIARLCPADERDIGKRRAGAAVQLDHELLLGAAPGGTGVKDGGAAQLQHLRAGRYRAAGCSPADLRSVAATPPGSAARSSGSTHSTPTSRSHSHSGELASSWAQSISFAATAWPWASSATWKVVCTRSTRSMPGSTPRRLPPPKRSALTICRRASPRHRPRRRAWRSPHRASRPA